MLHFPARSLKNFLLILMPLVLFACQMASPGVKPGPGENTATVSVDETATVSLPSPTATITPTPEPLAGQVNGEGILLSTFEVELSRFNAAQVQLGKTVSVEEARERVLSSLVDEALLAQAAAAAGHTVSDAEVQARMDSLSAELGGKESLNQWLTEQHFDEASFSRALGVSMAASWQRDQIMQSVPTETDQVHARQILVQSENQAAEIYQQLQAGVNFATLVERYDPVTGGDLGWFPQGYLTLSSLDEAVFSLEPGEYTKVIQTDFGYHILQLLERKVTPLSPDARQMLQRKAIEAWLLEKRSQSTIENFIQ